MTYEPAFDFDLKYGEAGERYVHELLHSPMGRCEVKSEREALETGNLYVEYQCRGRDGVWRPSGIDTSQADLWAFNLFDSGFVILAERTKLRYVAQQAGRKQSNLRECVRGSNPTKGVILRLSDIAQMAATVPFGEPT